MKIKNKYIAAAGFVGLLALGANAADITVDRIINSSTTWTKDNTYLLSGYTFVVTPNGAGEKTVLTIEPGTVIKGLEEREGGETGEAAALVISRGAMIHADGTPEEPIVFTSELDDLDGNLGAEDINLWGGLVVLGNASINSRADGNPAGTPAQDQIEGFAVANEDIGLITFGGTDDDDNSGVIRYVSIRHGGAVLGTANEINGLTLGGVGRGTTIEYVEIFANKDDGVEWFGGTVDARYLVAAFGNDDAFDYDQGWRGRGQFFFAIGTDIGSDLMDKAGEHDGATSPLDAVPVARPTIYNATYIGIGNTPNPETGTVRPNTAINARDTVATQYYNSIFTEFAKMLDLENDLLGPQIGEGLGNILTVPGDVDFANNVWWSHIAENNTPAGLNARPSGLIDPTIFWTETARNNVIADPKLLGVSRTDNNGLDPRPAMDSPALTGPFKSPSDSWYVKTNYKGAFSPHHNWLVGWTKLWQDGYLAQNATWRWTTSLGWVYSQNGEFVGEWVYVQDMQNWAFIAYDESKGTYAYFIK